jgi:hypothetical protein
MQLGIQNIDKRQLRPCRGVVVPWAPGSVWTTYPYQRHAGSLGWEPISFNKQRNEITLRTDRCECETYNLINGSCPKCAALPHTTAFRDFVQQAGNALDHTHWNYLTTDQLRRLLSKANQDRRQLRTRVRHIFQQSLFYPNSVLAFQLTETLHITWAKAR